ncbi:MAG: LUD domain-containing protein [Tannerellaceae bacterium]|jgi:L-lactate dehydrogenase complex protein LldG|nr:LUD domain-containing protein [Tannerellaceae bacterium]
MSSKDEILANIRQHIRQTYDLPGIRPRGICYPDKIAQFIEVSRSVGGEAILLQEGEDINQRIRTLYPEARTIASNLPGISVQTLNPDEVETPAQLNGTDLGIVRGEIGVAENGCVWIPQNVKEKALYFIPEYLLILLDKTKIVNNMHEAYAQLQTCAYDFGVFLSGPSKTADIEQALVVGAHGAKGLRVILV